MTKRKRKLLSDADHLRIEAEAFEHASEQKWPGTRCHKRDRGTANDAEEI